MTPPVVAGIDGMPRVELTHDSGSMTHVYLYGAHVTSWIPVGGRDVFYLSRLARFEPGVGIRGGIPVVFPQFADSGPLPKHGWLRKTEWLVDPTSGSDETRARFFTTDTEESRAIWPHGYRAELEVSLGESSLSVELSIINTGSDTFSFTSALHSYFSVADVRETSIEGLRGTSYLDKTTGFSRKVDDEEKLIADRETDRVYTNAPREVTLHDHASGTSLGIGATGFPDIVVWNPWERGIAEISDMPGDDYLRMICVEAALAVTPHTLAIGDRWSGGQHLTVLST
jgi:glucose-6-phosphate 1-epimerase